MDSHPPLNTDAFRALEKEVRLLTGVPKVTSTDVEAFFWAWEQLTSEYPSDAFRVRQHVVAQCGETSNDARL